MAGHEDQIARFLWRSGAAEADKLLAECERALEQYASRVYDVEQHSKAGEAQERWRATNNGPQRRALKD